MGSSGESATEFDLVRLLASTSDNRARELSRSHALLAGASSERVRAFLHAQRLLPLLGGRVLKLDPDFGGRQFSAAVVRAAEEAGSRARGIEVLAGHLRERLGAHEVAMLPLKGPFLARRLYDDPALRPTNDLDILVAASDLSKAVEIIAQLGFEVDALPRDRVHIHHVLRHPRGALPRIEVHWRLHWYEERFAGQMLERADQSEEWPQADPRDELAALLLYYARDGFCGLRTAADLAAWWDRYGAATLEPMLDSHLRDYPELRQPLISAARVAERTVGLPAAAIVPHEEPWRPRARRAADLANWSQTGELDQLEANIALVDALLSPPRGLRGFIGRRVWLPREEIAEIYGLDDVDGWRTRAWQLAHVPKIGLRLVLGLAGYRGRASTVRVPATN